MSWGWGLEMKVGVCVVPTFDDYGDLGAGPTSSSISSQALWGSCWAEQYRDPKGWEVPKSKSSKHNLF